MEREIEKKGREIIYLFMFYSLKKIKWWKRKSEKESEFSICSSSKFSSKLN